jgi:ectoine hydroxylase-related dioxygenase (phytanoyl-CoA dioxygenase family)
MNELSGYAIEPFYVYDVVNHKKLKCSFLDHISSMENQSLIENGQSISNTDWATPKDIERPYFYLIFPIMQEVIAKVSIAWGMPNLRMLNYWFQQYKKGDYHEWHSHNDALFSCVYYLDMADDNPKTTFNLKGREINIHVSEGQILIFPGFLPHTSKENKTDKTKTIISFNIG